MTEFVTWLNAIIDEHADGSSVKLGKRLGLDGRGTVGEWLRGNHKPSARSCKLLAQLPGVDKGWREIAELAEAELRHGSGNRAGDRDAAKLPVIGTQPLPMDVTAWPTVYPDCSGCNHSRCIKDEHKDRREVCEVFTHNGLPGLCEPWTLEKVVRVARLLAGIRDA